MAMDPELFLAQEEIILLVLAFERFAAKVNDPEERRNVLIIAGLDPSFVDDLRFDMKPKAFAQALVAKFKSYCVSDLRLNNHPMISLLQYLLAIYKDELGYLEIQLIERLIKRGHENFKALVARSSVGEIESPKGEGIGTGVLVGKRLLLTCSHVLENVKKAWVRFGYKSGCYGVEAGEVFELDLSSLSSYSHLDDALITIQGQPRQSPAVLDKGELNSGQEIRLIHHPLGKPVVISDAGQIVQLGKEYIDHDINTDHGSSGAPIFNLNWQVVAIHQGNPGIGRSVHPGTTSGVRISAIWNEISSQLS